MNKEKSDFTILLEKDNNISKSKQNFVCRYAVNGINTVSLKLTKSYF